MVFTLVIFSAGSPRVAFEYVWASASFFSPSMPIPPVATVPPAILSHLRRFIWCSFRGFAGISEVHSVLYMLRLFNARDNECRPNADPGSERPLVVTCGRKERQP